MQASFVKKVPVMVLKGYNIQESFTRRKNKSEGKDHLIK